MKNINEYFNYLYSLERVGMKYDLTNITRLLKALGNPHKKFKTIHIAGTNGKGATASFCASILQEQGLKTGLFTSPHLLKFNERIRINGKCIPDSYIKLFLNKHIKLIEKVKPSFFEVNTAMAFNYFAENNIDAAVVETGLGGRLDSTNVLDPEVCIITQIGIDHIQFLGSTLEKIAKEKAGIIKQGKDVIISDTNTSLVKYFRKTVPWQEMLYVDDFAAINIVKSDSKSSQFILNSLEGDELRFTIPLPGDYQPRNAATAFFAVVMFNGRIGLFDNMLKAAAKGMKNVVKNTCYRGRLQEVTSKGRKYIFDISHNPQAINTALRNIAPTAKDVIVFGIMADKDYKKAVKELVSYKANIIFTKPGYQRALEPDILLRASKNKKARSYSNIYEALETAENIYSKGGRIIVLGSFFMIHDAIKALKLEKHFGD